MKSAKVKIPKMLPTTETMKASSVRPTSAAAVARSSVLRPAISSSEPWDSSRLNVVLTHSMVSSMRSGISRISWAIWSTSSAPNMRKKTAAPTMAVTITSRVAAPRFIRRESQLTSGAMAIAANHDIRTVKRTAPPSSSRKYRNMPSAMTPSTTRPVRHTFDGTNVTWVRRGAEDVSAAAV